MKHLFLLFCAAALLGATTAQAGQLRPVAAYPEPPAPYATFLADTQPMDHTVSVGDVSFSYGRGKTPTALRAAEPATFFMPDRSDAGYSRYDLHLNAGAHASRTRYSLSYFEAAHRPRERNDAGGALQLSVERHTDTLNLHSGVSFASSPLEAADDPTAGPLLVNAGGATKKLGVNFVYLYAPDPTDNDAATGMRSLLSSAGAYSSALPLTILTLPGQALADKKSPAADETLPAGLRAYGLSVGVNLTDGLTLSGSLAYARTDRKKEGGEAEGYGWEYGLGAAYRFRDNLSYKAHAGYFSPGEYFDSQEANGISRESIYMLSNAITMTF